MASQTRPAVYLFYGEDEFEIHQEIEAMQARMGGDPAMVSLNLTHIDDRRFRWEEFATAVRAAPFLVDRRMVILSNPIRLMKSKEEQARFTSLLEQTPKTTALVIVEPSALKTGNWLLKWVAAAGKQAFVKEYPLLKGARMQDWITRYVRKLDGEISREAAFKLAEAVQENTRLAAMEIEKLLAYVGYTRKIEEADVETLISAVQETNVFSMVDAIGTRQGRQAMQMLRRLLEEQDPLSLFGMVIRQFRLLLLIAEQVEMGASSNQIASNLGQRSFVVQKMIPQARNFSIPLLEDIYDQLLVVDERIKTGQVDSETALETLVAVLTGEPA